jgi:beta-glucanase (GH16 family)
MSRGAARAGLLATALCLALSAGVVGIASQGAEGVVRSSPCQRHPHKCQTTPTPSPTPSPSGTPTPTPSPTPSPSATPTDPTSLPDWGTPIWHDEFDGDLSQWNVRNNDTANGMLERRMAANVTTVGGLLDIEARRENIAGTTQQFTSGYVDTIGRNDHVGPGTLTLIRAKFPTDQDVGKGMWSALWFRNENGPGEADMVEAYSNKPDLSNAWECVVITVHQNTDGSGSKASKVYRFPAGEFPSQVFHTYGMEVEPDRLIFTIDGTVVWTPTLAQYPWMAAELADTWNMRVNQQISAASQWFYAPDAGTVFPREMYVDFVRVYSQP